jgi:hypothetical protein
MSDDDTNPDTPQPLKVASRPGSRWAHGKRTKQQGYKQPQGFARGAAVKKPANKS